MLDTNFLIRITITEIT